MAAGEALRILSAGEVKTAMTRGVSLGVAVVLLLLLYFSASLLFDRTNPGREIQWIPVRQYLRYLPLLPGSLSAMRGPWGTER